jgi:hypothetical protein
LTIGDLLTIDDLVIASFDWGLAALTIVALTIVALTIVALTSRLNRVPRYRRRGCATARIASARIVNQLNESALVSHQSPMDARESTCCPSA